MNSLAQKKKKPFTVQPSIYAACVELTGSPTAGGLLCQIAIRSEKKTLTDEKGETGWLALSSDQWRVLTGFSRHQYNDALGVLKKKGLIRFRRRRLSKKHVAALAWLRLSENTKSAIAEIMDREGITAFQEIPISSISEFSDNMPVPISEETDSLIKMNISENDNDLKNVIVEKIITGGSSFSQDKGAQGKKKSETKKEWFEATVKEIYKNCPHLPPEPYKLQSAKALEEIKEYLEVNPAGFFAFCPPESDPFIYALGLTIQNWEDFVSYATGYFGAYNMPKIPAIWALNVQLKSVPEFVKAVAFLMALREEFSCNGITIKDNPQWFFDEQKIEKFIKLPSNQRKSYVEKLVLNSNEYHWHHKKNPLDCL